MLRQPILRFRICFRNGNSSPYTHIDIFFWSGGSVVDSLAFILSENQWTTMKVSIDFCHFNLKLGSLFSLSLPAIQPHSEVRSFIHNTLLLFTPCPLRDPNRQEQLHWLINVSFVIMVTAIVQVIIAMADSLRASKSWFLPTPYVCGVLDVCACDEFLKFPKDTYVQTRWQP